MWKRNLTGKNRFFNTLSQFVTAKRASCSPSNVYARAVRKRFIKGFGHYTVIHEI